MDERNIEIIRQKRTEAEQAQDDALRHEIDSQIEAETKQVDPREIVTKDILRGAELIRKFMRKQARRQTSDWWRYKEKVHLYSYTPDEDILYHKQHFCIETPLFAADDDLTENFTRSGWSLSLEEKMCKFDIPRSFRPYKDLDFRTDLIVARKTVSLGDDNTEASEAWYKIRHDEPTYIEPSGPFSQGSSCGDRIVSLPASDDKEYKDAQTKYNELYEKIRNEARIEYNDIHNADINIMSDIEKRIHSWVTFYNSFEEILDRKLKEHTSIKRYTPRTGMLALEHCRMIIQTALKELKIKN